MTPKCATFVTKMNPFGTHGPGFFRRWSVFFATCFSDPPRGHPWSRFRFIWDPFSIAFRYFVTLCADRVLCLKWRSYTCFTMVLVGYFFRIFMFFDFFFTCSALNFHSGFGLICWRILEGSGVHFASHLVPKCCQNHVKKRSEKWHRKKVVPRRYAGFRVGPSRGPGGG